MSDAALRRTIRRCTAGLLLPLSLVPWTFVADVEQEVAHDHGFRNLALEFGDEIAMLVFLGSLCYLAWSLWSQFVVLPGADEQSEAEPQTDPEAEPTDAE